MPSFLVPGVTRNPVPAGRGLVPTDPPRALVVPTVAQGGDKVAAAPGGIPVRVYFSRRPDSDSSSSAVFPVSRVAPDRAVATAALGALIAGPNAAERAAGYSSELTVALSGPSNCSGRNFGMSLVDGMATVRLCRAMDPARAGRDARLRSQIEATLRQFPTIRAVKLLDKDGRCLFDQYGRDGCIIGRPAATPGVPRSGQ